jgi:REP element-mobilizing transposase RayT
VYQGAASSAPTDNKTLGDVMRAFKSMSAINANKILDRSGQPFWQRNYYERIIRNEDELHNIRQYIHDNPINWEIDNENPTNPRNNAP